MKWWMLIVLALLMATGTAVAKNVYYMDTTLDCGYIGVQEVGRDQTINVHAKTTDTSSSSQGACSINFQAADSDAKLQVEFISFTIRVCGVKLYLIGGPSTQETYTCGDSDPRLFFSSDRSLTITLHKTDVTATDYNFQLRLTALRDRKFPPPTDSNPVAVGMVIGIVGGVFGFIIIVVVIAVCCFRKRRIRGPTKSPYLYQPETSKTKLDESMSHNSVGYTNENVRLGSPMSKRKLLAPSDSSDEKSYPNERNRIRPPSYEASVPPPPPVPNLQNSSYRPKVTKTVNATDEGKTGGYDTINNVEKNVNPGRSGVKRIESEPRTVNPVISGLNSNSKFRNSFIANERDAEERAKRISSTSSFEKFGDAPSPPSSDENISRPTLPPVPKSPKGKKSKHAGIGRNPRPPSLSSDEIKQIEKGPIDSNRNQKPPRKNMTDDDKDKKKVAPKQTNAISNREVKDFSSTSSVDDAQTAPSKSETKKANTTHSLRPDRKSPKNRKKEKSKSVSSALDPEPMPSPKVNSKIGGPDPKPSPRPALDRVANTDYEGSDFEKMGSGRYSKRAKKSPKHARSGKGFSHRRGRSADHLDSRPTTPTSNFGSMEDLEYLEPFQRAPYRSSSKSSLYSSRSSLYDRRGRRRHGSYSESIASHARDDISVMRHSQDYDDEYSDDDFDGYEKPLSRHERQRFYRSETDILGKRGKEIATQTLRETATQTGPNESVIMKPQVLVKKRRKSRSMSTSGTQTHDKKEKEAADEASGNDVTDSAKPRRKKTKRSKSVDNLDSKGVEKPKPKPKPAPRKSMSALDAMDESKTDEEKEKLPPANNLYYPTSEGFVPYYNPMQGYPGVPQTGYPNQQGIPSQGQPHPYPVPGQYGMQPPGQYPHMVQGVPPVPQQGGYPQGPQPYQNGINTTVDAKPRKKSNWEILCALTDGEMQRDMTETGSVASSVFTNNPSMPQGYGVPAGNPPFYNQGYYPPPMQQYPPPSHPSVQHVNMNPNQPQVSPVQPAQGAADPTSAPSQMMSSTRTKSKENLSTNPVGHTAPKVNLRTESIV